MDVFYHDLEAIKAVSFRCCYLGGKVVTQVLVDKAIRGSKECKDMGEKVAFVVGQVGPVHNVCGEVDLLDCPEGGSRLLVHVPDVSVLDGEQDKAMGVFL